MTDLAPEDDPGSTSSPPRRARSGRLAGAARQLGSGATQTAVFGLGMLLLGVVSLFMIPALIRSGGAAAWASIAVGQAVGGVTASLIGLGWGVSGPAAVARTGAAERWREYSESTVARVAVSVPTLVVSAALAAVLGGHDRALAALAATSAALVGFSSNWYFVGTAAPWAFFFSETVPRVVGSLIGIGLMVAGMDVAFGLLGQLAGIAVGVVASWFVVRRTTAATDVPALPRRPLRTVLVAQRHGVATAMLSMAYGSAPVVIVNLVNPAALPVYALLDKFQRQIYSAATPVVVVLQGWVARADDALLRRRIRGAHVVMVTAVVLGGLVVFLGRRVIFGWLGAGQLAVPPAAVALMCVWLGLNLEESVATRVSLVPLGRIAFMARITGVGSIVGLAATAVLAARWGTVGALIGICLGLILRLSLALYGARASAFPGRPTDPAEEKLA